MPKILRVIARNLKQGPATIRLPGSVPVPDGFRGRVKIDPRHCLACGMCSYVCVTQAITGSNSPAAFQWAYDPGRCTFCARCLERCPGSALQHGVRACAHLSQTRRPARIFRYRAAGMSGVRRPEPASNLQPRRPGVRGNHNRRNTRD